MLVIVRNIYAFFETDGVLYGVTGLSGILQPQGFTIDMKDDERYKTDIIASWSSEEVVS